MSVVKRSVIGFSLAWFVCTNPVQGVPLCAVLWVFGTWLAEGRRVDDIIPRFRSFFFSAGAFTIAILFGPIYHMGFLIFNSLPVHPGHRYELVGMALAVFVGGPLWWLAYWFVLMALGVSAVAMTPYFAKELDRDMALEGLGDYFEIRFLCSVYYTYSVAFVWGPLLLCGLLCG